MPSLVASYDIWPGNGKGLNLILALHKFVTYLLTKTLTHLLTARDPQGAHSLTESTSHKMWSNYLVHSNNFHRRQSKKVRLSVY